MSRVRIALALLAVIGALLLAVDVSIARHATRNTESTVGPVWVARAWLSAWREGDGGTSCSLLDPMLLERMGGTVGECALHFAQPHRQRFHVASVARRGVVVAVNVAASTARGTLYVEREGMSYRIVALSFRSVPSIAA
jgi:hypothetical protein